MKKDRSRDQDDDLSFMNAAIELARDGAQRKEGGPFGAVIVRKGTIVGKGFNRVLSTNDPTAHAEMVAIRAAAAQLGQFHLTDCILYTSCEPCPMCLAASYWARIKRIVYAMTRTDAEALGFSDAEIYHEISKPVDQRSIEMHQCARAHALGLRDLWLEKTNKTEY